MSWLKAMSAKSGSMAQESLERAETSKNITKLRAAEMWCREPGLDPKGGPELIQDLFTPPKQDHLFAWLSKAWVSVQTMRGAGAQAAQQQFNSAVWPALNKNYCTLNALTAGFRDAFQEVVHLWLGEAVQDAERF